MEPAHHQPLVGERRAEQKGGGGGGSLLVKAAEQKGKAINSGLVCVCMCEDA